ncbi:hypothetical protein BDV3_006308 [Batrachochytrium dendrobatidis]
MITTNSSQNQNPLLMNSNEETDDAVEYIPQAEHLQASPITKISPNQSPFSDTAGAKAEFELLCEQLKNPVQMVLKKDIVWSKRDPLHFWQSLAFTLRSEELTCTVVSSFVDTMGHNKLYIATNDPMTDSQQQETTEIINMFLDLKPVNEIAARLFPRHLSYIIKQFKKVLEPSICTFFKKFPNRLELLESLFKENNLPEELSKLMAELIFKQGLTLDDVGALMDLITDNRKVLRAMKDGITQDISKAARKMAVRLLKMIRLSEEIAFVWKKVQRHQQDIYLKSLAPQFQFISLDCHAELAILKTAKDCCKSTTLYIGVSERPCYCCSLFFKAIEENKSAEFNISIVTTHGKLYGRWNRIENCFDKEFNQVWAKVIKDYSAVKKPTQMATDDDDLLDVFK